MIALIWEDVNNSINSIISSLNEKFPREARYYLGRKPDNSEIELLTRPPLVFMGWLIHASKNTSVKVLEQLSECRSQNLVVIRVENQNDFDRVKQKTASLNVKVLDNHVLTRESMLTWVQRELFCSENTAKYIFNRAGGRMKELVFAVQTLKKSGQAITRKTVRELVDKSYSAGILDVLEYILGISSGYVKAADVFAVIYKFRYAESWILETLQSELASYITVHRMALSGALDIYNYVEKVPLIADKTIQKLPRWKLKRILLNFGKVSMEHMLLVQAMLQQIGKSYFDLIKIIQLLSLGGN